MYKESWLEFILNLNQARVMKFKSVITGLLFLLLTEMAFFSVLGVEHVLADAEPDSHAHSEFDLCDWLQIQTTGSLTVHVDLLSPVVF